MTVREMITELKRRLSPVYGAGETQAMIRIIFTHLKGWNTVQIFMHEGDELSEYIVEKARRIADRLLLGEPIQYITGIAPFCGMDLHVAPGVLIPRPETQQLVDMIKDRYGSAPDLRVLDVGTGSGCIAIALARALSFARVSAIDLSEAALKIARENAELMKAKIRFEQADLYEYLPGCNSLDIVVSNPPYIHPDEQADMDVNVLEHEPHQALFVRDSARPVEVYARIARIARHGLVEGGTLWLEINPRYAEQTVAAVRAEGFDSVETVLDIHQKKRFVWGQKEADR